MTPLETRKAQLREYIEARKLATSKFYTKHEKMKHFNDYLIGVECCEEEPFVIADMNRNMDNWKNDLYFITKAANESAKIAEQLLECIERWEKVADYSTCEELHPGCEKYKSYEDGWYGVAEYAKQTLNKIAGEK